MCTEKPFRLGMSVGKSLFCVVERDAVIQMKCRGNLGCAYSSIHHIMKWDIYVSINSTFNAVC